MSTERNVSGSLRRAVKEAWGNKCAILQLEDGEYGHKLHVDHIRPLHADGTNDPENLIPITDRLNLLKSKKRFPLEVEHFFHFLAQGRVNKVKQLYAKYSHTSNPRPALNRFQNGKKEEVLASLKETCNWPLWKTEALVKIWFVQGQNGLNEAATEINKTVRQCTSKLTYEGLYDACFQGFETN